MSLEAGQSDRAVYVGVGATNVDVDFGVGVDTELDDDWRLPPTH